MLQWAVPHRETCACCLSLLLLVISYAAVPWHACCTLFWLCNSLQHYTNADMYSKYTRGHMWPCICRVNAHVCPLVFMPSRSRPTHDQHKQFVILTPSIASCWALMVFGQSGVCQRQCPNCSQHDNPISMGRLGTLKFAVHMNPQKKMHACIH